MAIVSRETAHAIANTEIPTQFIWPDDEKPTPDSAEAHLHIPTVDLSDPMSGVKMVREACTEHGFFQVVNHGIPREVLDDAIRYTKSFFSLPFSEKQKCMRVAGETSGYSNSFTGRFSSKLPWKETLSFHYRSVSSDVCRYFDATLGPHFVGHG